MPAAHVKTVDLLAKKSIIFGPLEFLQVACGIAKGEHKKEITEGRQAC
jgi:hypothetical protein